MSRITTIKPEQQIFLDLSELWQYKDLFLIFIWRNLKVRYKQTILGVFWVIIQPLLTTFIFTIFFGNIAKISAGDLPYFLFVFCGLVYWNFFSSALTAASNSLIENENIIKKAYFPKIILPLSSVLTSLVDFAINFILLLVVIIVNGYFPSPLALLLIPVSLIITSLAASGLGLLLASFNVKYRDVRYVLPFFIQILIFLTPIIYPTDIVRPIGKIFLTLNPLTGVIESSRIALTQVGQLQLLPLAISFFVSIFFFLIGLIYFKNTERYFADIV